MNQVYLTTKEEHYTIRIESNRNKKLVEQKIKIISLLLILFSLTPSFACSKSRITEAKNLISIGHFKEALEILEKLNDNKSSEVLLILGNIFNGNSTYKVNYKKAFSFYKKSAELGNAEAAYNLGVLFYEGRGIPQNYTKAFNWYSKSSKDGFAPAQNNLGFLYQKGFGTNQSTATAYGWYSIAAANGSIAGLKNRELLLAELLENEGSDTVSDIQTQALECVKNNYVDCFAGE